MIDSCTIIPALFIFQPFLRERVVPVSKQSIAIFSACALSLSSSLPFAKSTEKSEDLSFESKIVEDGYFASVGCEKYIEGLALPEKDTLKKISLRFEVDEVITYASGGQTVIDNFEELFKGTKYRFNKKLIAAKEELKDKSNLTDQYEDGAYSPKGMKAADSSYRTIIRNQKEGSEQRKNVTRYIFCRIAATAIDITPHINDLQKYSEYVKSRTTKSQVGYFEVSADKGTYGPTVGTGNQFAEPKKWADSRFFIVHASFKNLDTESRIPVSGSLFINYNGKEYEFDSVEPIILEGYNIWLRKINPLITMKTKIVYRIPNEINGEVFWRPGRNPGDTKLWLGSIPAAK
ncbi:TPA: hypothetical protein N2B70_003484 [Pseudomonas aeruginosa]|nr:hypothetical protein [Pseudomonas aeruginosa]